MPGGMRPGTSGAYKYVPPPRSTPTPRTVDTLDMIGSLEGGAGAYVADHLAATDLAGGRVNPTHARQLQKAGYIEQIDPNGAPLRLTDVGRRLLAEAPPR